MAHSVTKSVQMLKSPREHFGEYRDTSARPPVRYSTNGKLIGVISMHCEKSENGVTDEMPCGHLNICPSIIPRSHWSCCGGGDRGSVYCISSPHPGEYRNSNAKPPKRYSSFHDYAGKIRHYCCLKDSKEEGFRCVHLDASDKIISCSHWSCCGNIEKHSTSCLVTSDQHQKLRSIAGASLSSKEIKTQVVGQKSRSLSDTFDPEVDSEFTDFEYEDTSESELSIEEYNDGPTVWSPSLSDQKFFGSEAIPLKIEIKSAEYQSSLKNQTSPILISSVLSPRASTNDERAAVQTHSAELQHIDKLSEKLAQRGFSVDLSRLRSKLLNFPSPRLQSQRSVRFTDTPRPSIRLPDVSEEPEAPRKVTPIFLVISQHSIFTKCRQCFPQIF